MKPSDRDDMLTRALIALAALAEASDECPELDVARGVLALAKQLGARTRLPNLYEIRPCAEDWSEGAPREVIEVDEDDAEFWGVYGPEKDADGTIRMMHVDDFSSRELAERFVVAMTGGHL